MQHSLLLLQVAPALLQLGFVEVGLLDGLAVGLGLGLGAGFGAGLAAGLTVVLGAGFEAGLAAGFGLGLGAGFEVVFGLELGFAALVVTLSRIQGGGKSLHERFEFTISFAQQRSVESPPTPMILSQPRPLVPPHLAPQAKGQQTPRPELTRPVVHLGSR